MANRRVIGWEHSPLRHFHTWHYKHLWAILRLFLQRAPKFGVWKAKLISVVFKLIAEAWCEFLHSHWRCEKWRCPINVWRHITVILISPSPLWMTCTALVRGNTDEGEGQLGSESLVKKPKGFWVIIPLLSQQEHSKERSARLLLLVKPPKLVSHL